MKDEPNKDESNKLKKYPLKYGTAEWRLKALELAAAFAPPIYECQKCGSPCLYGYCCSYCDSNNPSNS